MAYRPLYAHCLGAVRTKNYRYYLMQIDGMMQSHKKKALMRLPLINWLNRGCYESLLVACGVFLLSGCVPSLEPTRYFEHVLTVNVDGNQYDIKHFFTCDKEYDLSEADFKMYPRWVTSGTETVTTEIARRQVLIYGVMGDCVSDQLVNSDPEHFTHDPYSEDAISVLDRASDPQLLYELTSHGDFPVKVMRESIKRVDQAHVEIGPTRSEAALKETIRSTQHGFQRVVVTVLPSWVWDTTKDAHEYFGKMTGITAAKIGEARPRNGYPGNNVEFPFRQSRLYRELELSGKAVPDLPATYDGKTFIYSDSPSVGPAIWYANNGPKYGQYERHTVKVNYKGVVFDLAESQEVFDPATRNILVFYYSSVMTPWSPESKDQGK